MSRNDFKALIHSMMTAILTGMAISTVAIWVYSYSRTYEGDIVSRQYVEDELINNEEDPTFSSHISNSVIYSSESDFEISARDKSSLPTASKKRITASAYTVVNVTDDITILQKNQNTSLPLASVTKLVTAVVARKFMDSEQSIAITPEMTVAYGNEARFRIGEKMKIGELLYPLLLVSSNDASEAIAMSYSGGRKKFLKEMNNWVNSIGAYRTYFTDPSGLSSQNISTSNDIAIITKWILENDPEIFRITENKSKVVRTHTWTNPTRFLNLSVYMGGKNGYTPSANRTGVSIFQIGKQKKVFVVVLLGSSMRDNDTLDLLDEAVM
jgi:D-alanyl-D-alanine carboxypeptidase (penicillin-binding protein 5/6)